MLASTRWAFAWRERSRLNRDFSSVGFLKTEQMARNYKGAITYCRVTRTDHTAFPHRLIGSESPKSLRKLSSRHSIAKSKTA